MKMRQLACVLLVLLSFSAFAAKPQDSVTPAAQAHSDVKTGPAPLAVTFSARGSFDPDGGALTYAWDFGDGSTGTGLDVVHEYNSKGFFVAVLRVTDSTGLFDVASIEIRVGVDSTPNVNVVANPPSGNAPLTVQFSSIVNGGDAPLTYSWNFGDGTTGDLGQNPLHTYSASVATVFNVVLTVTDQDGDFAVATVQITVQP
jgi:PKD repeat protein